MIFHRDGLPGGLCSLEAPVCFHDMSNFAGPTSKEIPIVREILSGSFRFLSAVLNVLLWAFIRLVAIVSSALKSRSGFGNLLALARLGRG